MNWVEIISAVLGLSCVFLAGRNSKYNFWVGYVYNIFLFCLFTHQHLYSAMLLQPIAFGINVYGHWHWTHPADDEKSAADPEKLKVSHLDTGQWFLLAFIVAAAGALWALALIALPLKWPSIFDADPSPWLDSYTLMITLLAQLLSARKKWECWIVWIVVNVTNIALYLSSGLYLMPLVSLLYLGNGIWSLVSWRRMNKEGL